jgi:signal recognition particle subunit SRP72
MSTTTYTELEKLINEGATKDVLKACDRILKQKEDEQLALAVKFIALIQDNDFAKAIQIADSNPTIKKNYLFEIAYCHYRSGNCDEALAKLDGLKGEQVNHLRAQIEYKAGRYEKSSKLYENLKPNDEVLTNLSAAYILADEPKKALDAINRAKENTHELAYNGSCAAIDLGDFDQARKFLDLATKLCKESLSDSSYSEEEIQDELAPIRVQSAYVSHLTGDVATAEKIYESIMEHKRGDAVAVAVAANNLATIQGGASIFESAKKIKLATTDKVQSKLTTKQQRGIQLNNALLLLLQKKFDECRQLIKQFPTNSDVTPIMLAAVSYQEKKYDDSVSILQNALQKDKNNVRLLLTLAQLQINRGENQAAAELLKSSSIRHEPAVVSLLVKLTDDVVILNESVEYWKAKYQKDKNDKQSRENLIVISRAAANLNSQKQKFENAAQVFETLVNLDPNDKFLIAELVDALSYSDVSKAEKYLSKLPKINVDDLDVKKLEASTVTAIRTKGPSLQLTEEPQKEKKKRRKKRRNKPPKNLTGKIDPNRWLSKKKKKRPATTGFGTQGSSSESKQASLQHEKGQKTALKPEQVLAQKMKGKGVSKKKSYRT